MGGDATFSGTTYQARVIAYTYVHILAGMRLGWLSPVDDTPIAVSGETDGPGDDARIEFGDLHPAIEVQAKHGMTGGAKLQEALARVRSKSQPDDQLRVILVVDRGSTRWLYSDLPGDIERLRAGRHDALKPETVRLLNDLGPDSAVLRRLLVVPCDLGRAQDPEHKLALQLLAESVLEDREMATAALAVLATDAGDVCARKLRRTRKELVDLLAAAKIKVRPLARDDRWHRALDFSRQLLQKRHPSATLAMLTRIEAELGTQQVEPHVHYRLTQQRSAALHQLGRYDEALRCARSALDLEPSGSHALQMAAISALHLGDVAMACAFVERGLSAHPVDSHLWGAKAQVAAAAGEQLPSPPAIVATSEEYRTVLAQIATDAADWPRVLELTASILADGVKTPGVVFFRANALLCSSKRTSDAVDRERLEDVERLSSELIRLCADDAHPLTCKGYALRAAARSLLGRVDEAEADLRLARELSADDPDAIYQAARIKAEGGNDAGALELLRHPVVDEDPPLAAMRAHLFAKRGEKEAAQRDIDAALRHLAKARSPDSVRFTLAEAALEISDADLAERILTGVSPKGVSELVHTILRGRIAFARGNVDEGTACFREASGRDEPSRPGIVTELGSHLLRAGRTKEALQAFDELGPAMIPASALRVYANALMRADDLVRAKALVEQLAAAGPLPDWALRMAADIALRQEDVGAALRHLTALVEGGQEVARTRLVLAHWLLESGRVEEARPHLDFLLAEPALSPNERMETARLLCAAGQPDKGLPLSFRAFRDAPEDPRLHRGFIMLHLLANVRPAPVSEVGPDTHVQLKSDDGATREHTIYSTPPIDPLRRELSVADAQAAGLIGLKVGDTLPQSKDDWSQERWVVEAIVPAVVHALRDAMNHFAQSFPREPFFVRGFHVGDFSSVRDFAPFIASLEAQRARAAHVLAVYRKQMLPLGFVAQVLGCSMSDLMEGLTINPQSADPLPVEWADREDQSRSVAAAQEANQVVLTRSALKTAADLGLLIQLAGAFTLVAPMSLCDELRDELREAEADVTRGRTVLTSASIGLGAKTLPVGHPYLLERLEATRAVLSWLEASARLEPRPLVAIQGATPEEKELRDFIGKSSADALDLVKHLGATLYADDLGLRRLLLEQGSQSRTFSTVRLLPALVERGALNEEERDRHLLALVSRRYAVVLPSRDLLIVAVRRWSDLGRAGVEQAFALLGGPILTAGEAAQIAAQVIRWLVMAPLQVVSTGSVVRMALTGMSARWPRPLCCRLVAHAAGEELALMPQHLDTVRQVCVVFARGSLELE